MAAEKLLSDRFRFDADTAPYGLTEAQKAGRRLFIEEISGRGMYSEVDGCPYCRAKDAVRISETEKRGLPSNAAICGSCGGCFKSSVLTPEGDSYLYSGVSSMLRDKDVSDAGMEEAFRQRVRLFGYPRYAFISRFTDMVPVNDTVAEFGSGDGANLVPWRENGFKVVGLEIDSRLAKFGSKKGIETVNADAAGYDFSVAKPRLIILSHFLEHVRDADRMLERISDILPDNGYLFIEVPGIRRHGIVDTLKFFDVEHNYYFDKKSLAAMLERRSFGVVYADEYVRTVARPGRVAVKTRPPSGGIKAAALKAAMACFGLENAPLDGLLRQSAAGSLRIRLFNKLQGMYYDAFYGSMSRPRGRRQ